MLLEHTLHSKFGLLWIHGDNFYSPFPMVIYLNFYKFYPIIWMACTASRAAAIALVDAIAGNTFPIISLHW